MDRLEYLNKQYENILGWYKQSEQKAKFLLTVNTFAAGLVNGLVFVAADKLAVIRVVYSYPLWGLLLMAGAALIGSCVLILRAVWGRHRGSGPILKETEKLWFFAHIADMDRAEYESLMHNLQDGHVEATMIAENYILAYNVRTKYDALNWAISLTVAALILLFALGFVYALTVSGAHV